MESDWLLYVVLAASAVILSVLTYAVGYKNGGTHALRNPKHIHTWAPWGDPYIQEYTSGKRHVAQKRQCLDCNMEDRKKLEMREAYTRDDI